MNNHLAPRVYAQFVEALSISCMVPAAQRFVSPAVAKNQILNPTPAVVKRITFGTALGPSEALREAGWAQFEVCSLDEFATGWWPSAVVGLDLAGLPVTNLQPSLRAQVPRLPRRRGTAARPR